MITVVDKNGKVLKEVTKTVERESKDGKSLGSSSGITITVVDKAGNVIREEKAAPKKARRSATRKKEVVSDEE